MPSFLIAILIAGVILVPLGIFLWMGARERRRSLTMHDDELGDLNVFKLYWETATPKPLGQRAVSIAGMGSKGPTVSQRRTLDFLKTNAEELSTLAVAAAKKAATDAAAGFQLDDLQVSAIFLEKELNSFEMSVDSESCATAIPDGIAVSFRGKDIDEVEFVH
jgi:hypothetical protein